LDRRARRRVGGGAKLRGVATAAAASSKYENLVLLTREESKNGKLRSLLEGAGIETFELPLVEHTRNSAGIREVTDLLAGFARGVTGPPRETWFVSTSPESAAVLSHCWVEAGRPTAGFKVASIGRGTSKVLRNVPGLEALVQFEPSKATGKVLAAELPLATGQTILEEGAAEPPLVIYPSSELASGDVETGLAARGFDVKRINTYSTRPVQSLTEEQSRAAEGASVVTFGSPSAIRAWASLVGRKQDVYCCCIGGTSHDACLRNGFEETMVFSPEKPGLDGWAKTVARAIENRKHTQQQQQHQ